MSKVLAQGIDVASSTAKHSVNERYTDGKTGKEYVYVQASGAIDAQDAVVIDESGTAKVVNLTNTASAFGDRVGVANHAISDTYYAWVQVYGATTVNVLANCAANTTLNSTGTDGTLDDDGGAGSEDIDGIVLTTANGGATAAAACFLSYPTVGATN
jgi:hypothetical protein